MSTKQCVYINTCFCSVAHVCVLGNLPSWIVSNGSDSVPLCIANLTWYHFEFDQNWCPILVYVTYAMGISSWIVTHGPPNMEYGAFVYCHPDLILHGLWCRFKDIWSELVLNIAPRNVSFCIVAQCPVPSPQKKVPLFISNRQTLIPLVAYI